MTNGRFRITEALIWWADFLSPRAECRTTPFMELVFRPTTFCRRRDVVLFFKYYDEYSAKARPQGRTIVFGGSWTLKIPKPAPPKK